MLVASPARQLSAGLSGYLCGTRPVLPHLLRPTTAAPSPHRDALAAAHREFSVASDGGDAVQLGRQPWRPKEQAKLAECLRREFVEEPVVDLILFGSQARGGRTGFSDVDAILVIRDEAAESAASLRTLRPRVLAGQRAVLAYQPMQHHGFEVVTPKLLQQARDALALPYCALLETKSLKGVGIRAQFAGDNSLGLAFDRLSTTLRGVSRWPTHPWDVHRLLAMFELLPAVYLQRKGADTPKWESFERGRLAFAEHWWPYDVLAEVRAVWPRRRRSQLEILASTVRNPWLAVAAWRKLPVPLPAGVQSLLTPRLLDGLHVLLRLMTERP
jgi:Nucleotidyltransferase domain